MRDQSSFAPPAANADAAQIIVETAIANVAALDISSPFNLKSCAEVVEKRRGGGGLSLGL
jgi:hypothetical protein